MMNRIANWWHRAIAEVREIAEDDTGDVPGWVLVTLMTAGFPVVTVMG